jgi:hypothetical protein
MANYFSKYQGRGGPAIAPGIVQMMGSIGDEYAKGIEGLAEGIEKYRKNKSELNRAQADFENLSERTDPEVVMYSVDSKRMQKIQDGKGTAEDFLSATNSINAKIEDIEKFKKQDADEQDRQADRDYRSATLAQGDERVAIAKAAQAASIIKSDAERVQDKADIASFQALHSGEDTFDEERYRARSESFMGTWEDLDKLQNMSAEEGVKKFRRPKSPLEKANEALAVEGISTEQAGFISSYLQRDSDEALVMEVDPVTGARFFRSKKTGSVTPTGYDPDIAGDTRPMSEGDKGRLERATKSKKDDRKAHEKEYRKLETDIPSLEAKIASDEDLSEDQGGIDADKAKLKVLRRHKEELRKKLGLPAASTSTGDGSDGGEADYNYDPGNDDFY